MNIKRSITNLRQYLKTLGFVRGPFTYFKLRLGSKGELVSVKPPGGRSGILLRRRTVDVCVWDEVFISKDYDFGPLAIAPCSIVDAGANIGMTSVFYSINYPTATILALEPDTSNFELLRQNAALYPSIHPLKAALWVSKGQISFHNPQSQSVSGFCMGSDAGTDLVDSVSIESILAEQNWPGIDILKMDIEGAEKIIFQNSATWIGLVQHFAIEFHDRKLIGCEDAFKCATMGMSLTSTPKGSNHLYSALTSSHLATISS